MYNNHNYNNNKNVCGISFTQKHKIYKSSLTQSQENYLQYSNGFINILQHILFVLPSKFTVYNH